MLTARLLYKPPFIFLYTGAFIRKDHGLFFNTIQIYTNKSISVLLLPVLFTEQLLFYTMPFNCKQFDSSLRISNYFNSNQFSDLSNRCSGSLANQINFDFMRSVQSRFYSNNSEQFGFCRPVRCSYDYTRRLRYGFRFGSIVPLNYIII